MSLVNAGRSAVLFLLAVIVIFHQTSFSHEEPKPNSVCKHCFTAKRYPACCSYWVTDLGFGVFTSSFDSQYNSNIMAFADLGYMINLNEKTSIGGTFFGVHDVNRRSAGVRFRYQRWLSDKTTLNFSPGIMLFGVGDFDSSVSLWPAFIATAHISYNSRINGYVGMEIFRMKQFSYPNSPTESTESTFFLGAGVGQEAGLGGMGLGALGALIFVIALAASFGNGL